MRIGLEIIINQIPIIDDNERERLISEMAFDSLYQSHIQAKLDKMRRYLILLLTRVDDKKVKVILRDLRKNIENAAVIFDLEIENFDCSECAFRRFDYERHSEYYDIDGEYILEYENARLECVECGNAYQQAMYSACSALF